MVREQTANAECTEKFKETTAEMDAKGLSIYLGDRRVMHAFLELLKAKVSVWSAIIPMLGSILSVASFTYVRYDRRIKLVVRPRKGDWYILDPAIKGNETLLRGVIEVYNHSSRPNTICGYNFWVDNNGVHEDLESEMGEAVRREQPSNSEGENKPQQFNVTPLTLAPYSGIEVPIWAIVRGKHVLLQDHLPVTIEVEDVFGKRYKTEVKDKRSLSLVGIRVPS